MEQARTEYRGALLWMKDASQELDPDTCKQMEKFRKVQMQVRNTKTQFDKLKMDVCQKVDLLGASRCNMLSHCLAIYQMTFLHFCEKTAQKMSEIHEGFKCLHSCHHAASEKQQFNEQLQKLINQSTEEVKVNAEGDTTSVNLDKLILLDEDASGTLSGTADRKENHFQLSKFADTEPCIPEKELPTDCLEEDFESDFSFLENLPRPSSSCTENITHKSCQTLFDSPCMNLPVQGLATEAESLTNSPGFLPSQLLDFGLHTAGGFSTVETSNQDMSAWFSAFADLDPLSNPDAIGRSDDDLLTA